MNGNPDRKTLLEVQEFFGLPSPALVEKDWFVVRALAAIHDVQVDGLTLAFGGGTALGRAYRLLERMSEDIDLRNIRCESVPDPQIEEGRDCHYHIMASARHASRRYHGSR